jgi:hypothetical protein
MVEAVVIGDSIEVAVVELGGGSSSRIVSVKLVRLGIMEGDKVGLRNDGCSLDGRYGEYGGIGGGIDNVGSVERDRN